MALSGFPCEVLTIAIKDGRVIGAADAAAAPRAGIGAAIASDAPEIVDAVNNRAI